MVASSPDVRAAADRVEGEAIRRLRPTAAFLQRLSETRTALTRRAEEAARDESIPMVRCLIAGSAARGGFLADRVDIDLFLLFPPAIPRAQLERDGLRLARAVLPDHEVRYAEHPYLRGRFEGFQVDAVPGYAVGEGSKPQSAVDRTPFHQAYLEARETPELLDQIRLTKAFLRALGVYGSEARTGGFSGYLVELLVLRFGSFRGLLEASRGWHVPVRLASTPQAAPRVPDDVALVLDDPVDPERNVSSALTRRNLALFLLAANAYLEAPSAAAFEPRPVDPFPRSEGLRRIEERGTHVGVLVLARPDLVDDILFPQLRKTERAVREAAERWGFQPIGSGVGADARHLLVGVEVSHARLPAVRLRDGPPVDRDRVGSFLAKWTAPGLSVVQGPYVRPDGSLAVETLREHRTFEAVLREGLHEIAPGQDLRPLVGDARCVPISEAPEGNALEELLRELLGKRLTL